MGKAQIPKDVQGEVSEFFWVLTVLSSSCTVLAPQRPGLRESLSLPSGLHYLASPEVPTPVQKTP